VRLGARETGLDLDPFRDARALELGDRTENVHLESLPLAVALPTPTELNVWDRLNDEQRTTVIDTRARVIGKAMSDARQDTVAMDWLRLRAIVDALLRRAGRIEGRRRDCRREGSRERRDEQDASDTRGDSWLTRRK
jgi:hypothetical protein